MATERLTGRRVAEIAGASVAELRLGGEEEEEAIAAAFAGVLEGKDQIVEAPFDGPAGRRWLEWRIVPERGAGGAVDRLLAVSRDVTERRAAEQVLRESHDLKTAMLASVSHELRTPLTAIAAAADALGSADPGQAPDLLELITGETTRLERMVANLLDLSRLQGSAVQPHLEIFPVDTIVGAALEAAAGLLGDAPVELDLREDAALVTADPLMCERIMVNLLHNAVAHGAPPVRVTARRAGGLVELCVCDAGPGVPAGDEARIFEPFIHGGAPGSAGVGLALARALAEAQGARLELRRAPGTGAVFALGLPPAAVEAERPFDEPAAARTGR
jgi:two-component system sensor histidine kinase KdpD